MTIKLIGDLMINEYEENSYKIRISSYRNTGELLSVIVDEDFFGESISQVYYGKIAKDVYRRLLQSKIDKALGGNLTLDLSEFFHRGLEIRVSKEMN